MFQLIQFTIHPTPYILRYISTFMTYTYIRVNSYHRSGPQVIQSSIDVNAL